MGFSRRDREWMKRREEEASKRLAERRANFIEWWGPHEEFVRLYIALIDKAAVDLEPGARTDRRYKVKPMATRWYANGFRNGRDLRRACEMSEAMRLAVKRGLFEYDEGLTADANSSRFLSEMREAFGFLNSKEVSDGKEEV